VSSAASTNDLKPTRRSRSICIYLAWARFRSQQCRVSRLRRERRKLLVERLKGRCTLELGTVNEESWGRIDIELLGGYKAAFDDFVLSVLVGEAGLEVLFAHAAELRQALQGSRRIAGNRPLLLRLKERIDKPMEFLRRCAPRHHRGAQGRLIKR